MEENLSSALTRLRFPLIVLVVLIHSYAELSKDINMDSFQVSFIMAYMSKIVARSAVPLFFVISGYFFFFNTNFNIEVLRGKILRRVFTLLIPYLFWNILFLVLYAFKDGLPGGILLLWNGNKGMPICYPFWFIRELMCMCILSPMIWYAIIRCRYVVLPLLILWFIYTTTFTEALAFYVLGSTLSIYRASYNIKGRSCACIVFGYLIVSLSFAHFALINEYVLRVLTLFGTLLFVSISFLFRTHTVPDWISRSTLFVLGCSTLLLIILTKVFDSFGRLSNFTLFFVYLTNSAIAILISLLLYRIISKVKWGFILTGRK